MRGIQIMTDIEIAKEAVKLEEEAEKRYREQEHLLKDPFLVALVEGLRRNEEDHGNFLREAIRRLGG